MQKTIVVTFVLPGFHVYDTAPLEVAFLRSQHRHLFKFKVYCRVTDSDRELEFFIVQRRVKEFVVMTWSVEGLGYDELLFGGMSCEMIGERILNEYQKTLNMYRVEVWEDGENGGIVEV